MLTLYHNGSSYPLQVDDYYVRQLVSGLDEVIFDISVHDPIYAMLQEEEQITDRGGQTYLVKQIDAGAARAKVICQLDLDAWKGAMYVGYNSGSKTCLQTIEAVAPSGWTVYDRALYSQRRTIEGDYTALEICEACRDVFKVYIRWDNKLRTVTIFPQSIGEPVGSFATRELNLKEINYKGKSLGFATRLYAYGKDGLTITSKTGGAPYVDDHTYSDKIISAYWKDERYTVVQNLYDDAKARLAQMAKPVRTYECAIVDLQATNPEKYGALRFDLLTVAMLVDDTKGTSVNYQVVERHEFPYYPERNEVIFDSAPQKITNSVTKIADAIENPNSDFQQIMDAEIDLATGWLTNAESYCRIIRNPDGSWKELVFLDGTQDLATATRVMRLNSAGLGFSKTGINGRYTNAFVFDDETGGHLIADVITAGTMSAARVRTGVLQSVGNNPAVVFDLDNGTLTLNNKALRITAGNFTLDANGNVTMSGKLTAQAESKIGPWNVTNTSIWYGNSSYNNKNSLYFGTSGISIKDKFRVGSDGKMVATDVTLSGKIQASSGYIGGTSGFTIDSLKIYNGKTAFGDASHSGVYIGTDGISIGLFKGGSAIGTGVRISNSGLLETGGIRFFTGNGLNTARYGLWAKNGGTHIGSGGPCDFNSENSDWNYLRNRTQTGLLEVQGELSAKGGLKMNGTSISDMDDLDGSGHVHVSGDGYFGGGVEAHGLNMANTRIINSPDLSDIWDAIHALGG